MVPMAVLLIARPMKLRGSLNHYFRPRVPSDIRAKAKGQHVTFRLPGIEQPVTVKVGDRVKVSLRTSDKRLAERRHGACAEQWAAWCEQMRNGPQPLTKRQRVALSGLLYRAFADRLEDHVDDPELWQRVKAANEYAMAGPVLGIYPNEQAGRLDALEWRFGALLDLLLQREGLSVTEDDRTALLKEAGRALTEAAAKLERNASGDYRPDPVAERFPAWERPQDKSSADRPSLTFDDLWSRYERERTPAPKTVATYKGYLKQFTAFLGHDDPRRVTKADILRFKDHLIAQGLSLKTIKDGHLAMLKALFGYAVDNDLVPNNPAQGVKVSLRDQPGTRKLPYTDEEVEKLLMLADQEKDAARRWLPWIMATSGCRVGEAAQLWGDRIVKVGGVWVMRIAPAPDGGRIKNKGSERDVPIHPALVERGFLDFAKEKASKPLFYGRRGNGKVHASTGVRNHLAEWIRKQGFTDRRKLPSHAFRHYVKNKLRVLGVDHSVICAIQGWREPGASATYTHVSLREMDEAVRKLPVPPLRRS
jgi:site-specific recombinase XerD